MPRPWRWLFEFAFRRSLARAEVVGAHRPKCADRLRALGVSEERLKILHVGAKIWEHMPSQEEARHRFELPQDAPIIMSVSRFTGPNEPKERKTEMVVNLLAALVPLPSNVILLVVGDGPGAEQDAAESPLDVLLAQICAGQREMDQVMSLLSRPVERCLAAYFGGVRALTEGRRTDAAAWFERSKDTADGDEIFIELAQWQLARLLEKEDRIDNH